MSRVALLKYVKKQKEETLYTTNSIPRGGTTLQPAFPVLECQNVVLDAQLPWKMLECQPEGMPECWNAGMLECLECWNAGMPGMPEGMPGIMPGKCSSYFFFFSSTTRHQHTT